MITFVNDLNKEISMTEQEFKQETIDMIKFAVDEKGYDINSLTTEFICQDISGHTATLTEEQFPTEARNIVSQILSELSSK